MDLPPDLRLALSAELGAAVPKALKGRVATLSARYRGLDAQGEGPAIRSEADAIAYAAYRMPATFAAIHAALAALRAGAPGWQPSSLLDAGAGPGTAAWAAGQLWPELSQVTLLERDERMIALGQRLARQANARHLRTATWRRVDLTAGAWNVQQSDLVVAAYVLGELPPEQRDDVVARLWAHTAGVVVMVEPGTPRGFASIRQARTLLIDAGATIAAPCPHDAACPMLAGDWCHFAQRLTRTPLHRGAKAAALSYEDEKYSYLAAVHWAATARAARVLRHPQTRKGHIIFELCTPAGLQRRTVSRKEGTAYRQAREARWGSTLDLATEAAGAEAGRRPHRAGPPADA